MESLLKSIDTTRVPRHIAIIMDGNGRWAKSRGMERSAGHVAGVDAVRRVIEAGSEAGVEYMTLYAFSTENWNRPKEEVDALLHLIVVALERETSGMIANGVRLNVIGDCSRLPEESMESLRRSIDATSKGTGMQVNLALSYSSRWEITKAVRDMVDAALRGDIESSGITEDTVSDYLTTHSIPDPDLLIRTGGDERVSNFLLWQIAYSELYFTDMYWPDFDKEALYKAIVDYQSRERRFGKTSEQITRLEDQI